MKLYDVIIIGGGAAGFFAAINIAELNPLLRIAIIERGKEGLQKVKISGGGRCNVTHAEFIPSVLTQNYPRGEKELLGPFHTFMTGDIMTWFEARGVPLKTEEDGRVFPVSDTSQTIIDCFLQEAEKHNVEVFYGQTVKAIKPNNSDFYIETTITAFRSDKVIITTGSSPKVWRLLETLGHNIVTPVPSLFTFNCKDDRIKAIPGVVVKEVSVKVVNTNLVSEGPLLITHVGFSAQSILKLSAFGAVTLAKMDYKFKIEVNFIRESSADTISILKTYKTTLAKKTIYKFPRFDLPKRLWHQLVLAAGINIDLRWAEVNKNQLEELSNQLTRAIFKIDGKNTFKEEFVTAGGVDLKEINFKTFESKIIPNLYFAGEVINVDAVTGGFNFQNAWTGAYIVAKYISAFDKN